MIIKRIINKLIFNKLFGCIIGIIIGIPVFLWFVYETTSGSILLAFISWFIFWISCLLIARYTTRNGGFGYL